MPGYTIRGGASCVWGVAETAADIGTITDVNYDDAILEEPCETQEGAVDGMVIFDGNMTAKMTIVAKISAILPAKGSWLTIGGIDFVVQRVGTAKRHKGKMVFTIDAIHHDNMTKEPA